MAAYELLVVLKPDLGEEEFKEALSELKLKLEKKGVKFTNEEIWGKRRLAYRIKKWEEGFYVLLRFKTEVEALKEIRQVLRLKESVIRYLLTKGGGK